MNPAQSSVSPFEEGDNLERFDELLPLILTPDHVELQGQAEEQAAKKLFRISAAWGWFPALSLSASFGVLLISIAFFLSKSSSAWAENVYWLGLIVIVLPVAARLASVSASRGERICLVVLTGMALYMVKVLHSPYAFTFPDEQIHFFNELQIIATKHLFFRNPLLPVTPFYPGLETVAAALATVGGFSPFVSGILVIGAARFIVILALFLLYEKISGSTRSASMGVMVYIGTFNFLYWNAQFSYESLSVPLAIFVLLTQVNREQAKRPGASLGFTVIMLLAVFAVVFTHHLSSIALLGFLVLWGIVSWLRSSPNESRISSWGLGVIGFLAIGTWLLYVASQTVGYVAPVLLGAINSVWALAGGESASRQLFSSEGGHVAPIWERIFGLGGQFLYLLAFPFGLLQVWRRYREPTVAAFALVALAYFPILVLRLIPAAWEVSNRLNGYLFIGLSYVLGLGISWFLKNIKYARIGYLAAVTFILICFISGVVSGWDPGLRLSRPYRIGTTEYWIDPQGVAAGKWAGEYLKPGSRIAVDESNSRTMLVYGNQYSLTGERGGIRHLLLDGWMRTADLEILSAGQIRYAVVDRRKISWNSMTGLYFDRMPEGFIPESDLIDREAYTKFDGLRFVSRILDSGNIVIYDVGVLSDAAPVR